MWSGHQLESLADGGTNLTWQSVGLNEPVALTPELLLKIQAIAEACSGDEVPKEHLRGLMAFLMLYMLAGLHKRHLSSNILCRVHSELPVGAGLGSSAAYSAAVCGALFRLADVSFCGTPEEKSHCSSNGSALLPCKSCKHALNHWTYQSERVLHGNPSGIDNSIAIYGGALSFIRGQGITPLERMPVLPLVLTDTRVPRSTQQLVAGVGARRDKFPVVMGPVLSAIGNISKEFVSLISRPDSVGERELLGVVGTLVDMNQGLLECIGVSHPAIRRVINAAAPYHYHTKLTGAGGGGCVLTLIHDALHKEELCKAIEDLGMRPFDVLVGCEGLSFVGLHTH